MSIDLEELEQLAKAASAGPWSMRDGPAPVTKIWSDDHPVALVVQGAWVDEAPSIRLEGAPPHVKAVPYMAQTGFGEVSEAQAIANRRYIAAAHPGVVLQLIDMLRPPPVATPPEVAPPEIGPPMGLRARLADYFSVRRPRAANGQTATLPPLRIANTMPPPRGESDA